MLGPILIYMLYYRYCNTVSAIPSYKACTHQRDLNLDTGAQVIREPGPDPGSDSQHELNNTYALDPSLDCTVYSNKNTGFDRYGNNKILKVYTVLPVCSIIYGALGEKPIMIIIHGVLGSPPMKLRPLRDLAGIGTVLG